MKNYSNIHFLDNEQVEIEGVTFVGGTLWTDMNRNDPTTLQLIEGMMNDFRIIRNSQRNYGRFAPLDAVVHHRETLEYIKSVVDSDTTKKYVVVGHHAPCALSISETYKNEYYMNGGYYSDLSEFILDRPQISLWTHGHMHNPSDYMMGGTRIVCNPRGYKGHDPHADYFELKFLEI
jgi:Icc-related predicted phosphoesterase